MCGVNETDQFQDVARCTLEHSYCTALAQQDRETAHVTSHSQRTSRSVPLPRARPTQDEILPYFRQTNWHCASSRFVAPPYTTRAPPQFMQEFLLHRTLQQAEHGACTNGGTRSSTRLTPRPHLQRLITGRRDDAYPQSLRFRG